MRGEQYSRHWRILQEVLGSEHGRRVDEIAREIACSSRTVRRDLASLVEGGFPLEKHREPRGTVWMLTESFRTMPPVPFTPLEALALVIASHALRSCGETFFESRIETILDKLKAGRAQEFRRILVRIRDKVFAQSVGGDGDHSVPGLHDTVVRAILEKRKLRVVYRDFSGKVTRNRLIAPVRLWMDRQALYLVAHCYRSNKPRTFNMRRFEGVVLTDEHFGELPDPDLEKQASESIGVFHADPEDIELEFDPILRTHIVEHPIHPLQRLFERRGRPVVCLRVGINETLLGRLMGLGDMVRVCRPEKLARLVASRHHAAAELYGK